MAKNAFSEFRHTFVLTNEAWDEPMIMRLEKGVATFKGINTEKVYAKRTNWNIERYSNNLWSMCLLGCNKVYDYFTWFYHRDMAEPLKASDFTRENYSKRLSF